MDLLIGYHRYLVEGWLVVMLLDLFLPFLLRGDPERSIFWTRVGYFAFWALWSMVLFSGLIVFVFMKQPLTAPVIVMLVASVLLPLLDAYRAIRLGRIWVSGGEGTGFSTRIVLAEILLVTGVSLFALVR